jgi:hypothetical protein
MKFWGQLWQMPKEAKYLASHDKEKKPLIDLI